MKAEKLATGVFKRMDESDWKWFEVACQCGDPDHYHSVWIELDRLTNDVMVEITTETRTDFERDTIQSFSNSKFFPIVWIEGRIRSLINETVRRVKGAGRILFKGHIKYETSLVMTPQQAYNYGDALKKGAKEIEKLTNG